MKKAVSIKIEISLWKTFKKYCIDKDVTMSNLLEKLIKDEMGKKNV